MKYTSECGKFVSNFPTSEKQAIKVKKKLYKDYGNICERCGTHHTVRWVGHPGSCYVCMTREWANDLQRTDENVVGINTIEACKNGPHLLRTENGRKSEPCITCQELKTERARQKAIISGITPPDHDHHAGLIDLTGDAVSPAHIRAQEEGRKWFAPDFRCPNCGTTAARHVDHPEKCQGCWSTTDVPVATPRQLAVVAGEKWYIPDKPCKRCNVIAPVYVANSRCKACQSMSDMERIVVQADMYVPMRDIENMGLRVYMDDDGQWRWLDQS